MESTQPLATLMATSTTSTLNSSKSVHHPLPFAAVPSDSHPTTQKQRPLSTSTAITSPSSPRPRQHALSIDGRTAFPSFFPPNPPPAQSTTHAGGIQPSASFFHPSRPTHFSRPSSSDSSSVPSNTIPPILAP